MISWLQTKRQSTVLKLVLRYAIGTASVIVSHGIQAIDCVSLKRISTLMLDAQINKADLAFGVMSEVLTFSSMNSAFRSF